MMMEFFPSEMPLILRQPDNVEADIGETFRLECTATGRPHPIIHWMHNE
jgi:hypothetical protein